MSLRGYFPIVLGLLLPWQTVWLWTGESVYLSAQVFLVEGVCVAWWALCGAPKAKELGVLASGIGAWSALSLAPLVSISQSAMVLAAVMLAVTLHTLTVDERARFVRAVILGAVPVVLLAIAQVAFGHAPASTLLGLSAHDALRPGESVFLVNGERVLRAYGSFPHPNILAAYGVLVTALGLYAQEKPGWQRLAVTLGIATVLLSVSRAGFLAEVLTLLTYRLPRLRTQVVLGVTVLAFVLLFIAPALLLFRGDNALEARSVNERTAQWSEAAHALSNPRMLLVGAGPGAGTRALWNTDPAAPSWRYQPPHFTPLAVFLDFGLIGSALLALFVFRLRPIISPLLILFLPFAFFDHFLWTLWPGLAFVAILSTLASRLLDAVPSLEQKSARKSLSSDL